MPQVNLTRSQLHFLNSYMPILIDFVKGSDENRNDINMSSHVRGVISKAVEALEDVRYRVQCVSDGAEPSLTGMLTNEGEYNEGLTESDIWNEHASLMDAVELVADNLQGNETLESLTEYVPLALLDVDGYPYVITRFSQKDK